MTTTQKQRRARYMPHQQALNALACHVCGIRPTGEIEWIEADLAANVDKAEKAQRYDIATALLLQNKYGDKL